MTPVHSASNTAQTISPHEAVAQPLNERTADCASEVAEQLEKFGVPQRSKRAQAEAERRAKKKYAERWHRSMGGREQVSNVRGYSGEVKATPAYNRPDVDAWRPQNVATRSLSDRAPFAASLSGYDPGRVALEGYACWTAGG